MIHVFFARRRSVGAWQFDGSPQSAATIDAALPRQVARSVAGERVLMVIGAFDRLVPVAAGDWIVTDYHGPLDVMSDRDFRAEYAAQGLPFQLPE